MSTKGCKTEKQAIDIWNRRSPIGKQRSEEELEKELQPFRSEIVELSHELVNTRRNVVEYILNDMAKAFPRYKGISSSHAKIHRYLEELAKQEGVEIVK